MSKPVAGPSYVYISKRLVESMVNRKRASDPKWESQGLVFRFPGVAYKRGPVDIDGNPVALADAAEQAFTDRTGTLEYPDDYVGGRFTLRLHDVPFDHPHWRAAWIVVEEGSTLVVLCGSRSNLIGTNSSEARPPFTASSPLGMWDVLKALRGRKSPPGKRLGLSMDEESAREAAEDAAFISSRLPPSTLRLEEDLDVLFEVLLDVPKVRVPTLQGDREWERVVVGATVFAREPSDWVVPGSGRRGPGHR